MRRDRLRLQEARAFHCRSDVLEADDVEAEREEIKKLTALSADERKPVELDQTTQGRLSRMDALQVQEMALEQERRRKIELKRIGSALQRIEDGDYGYCTLCGGDIELKRLEIDPAVPLCLVCAQG